MPARKLTYCPICGHTLGEREVGGRTRATCENCGYVHFVNPVPGVGILIEMDGGIVLIQRGHPPHAGDWAFPSGFVEVDESAEEAAIREAEEETGLKIEIIELGMINSFPEGPPVSGIMIFYRARPVGGELRAGDDASQVKVFRPDELPRLPFRTHREMLARWLDMQQHPSAPEHHEKPSMRIRSFAPTDADKVMALLALIPGNRDLSPEDWRLIELRMLESPFIEVFVAETGDTIPLIIGCVALSIVRGLTESLGMIGDMAVLPAYQRRGVGAELLSAVMRRATELNLRSLWVNRTRANNQARAFYAALGFAEFTDLIALRLK